MAKSEPAKRRNYTITKFGQHRDGYLHCRIVFEGKAYYATEQFGSWMIPSEVNGKKVMKDILSPYKEELAAKGRQFKKYLAKKALDERDKAASAEAKVSLEMGYGIPDVEKALMKRFELTKDQASDIVVASLNTSGQLEEKNNGTTEE